MIWFIGFFVLIFLIFASLPKTKKEVKVIKVTSSDKATSFVDDSYDEEKDSWERFDFYSAKMIPGLGRYKINYEDQLGLKTERIIKVKRVHESFGKFAIDAHCELRDSHRCFIDERVKKAINIDTGVIVESLALDAIAQFKDSGEGRALEAIDKEWVGMAILVFIAKADGQMRKEERFIIAEYLKNRCSNIKFDEFELDSAIKAIGDMGYKEFKRMINDIKKAGEVENLKLIFESAKKVVETQKVVDPMEKLALEFIAKTLEEKLT